MLCSRHHQLAVDDATLSLKYLAMPFQWPGFLNSLGPTISAAHNTNHQQNRILFGIVSDADGDSVIQPQYLAVALLDLILL